MHYFLQQVKNVFHIKKNCCKCIRLLSGDFSLNVFSCDMDFSNSVFVFPLVNLDNALRAHGGDLSHSFHASKKVFLGPFRWNLFSEKGPNSDLDFIHIHFFPFASIFLLWK